MSILREARCSANVKSIVFREKIFDEEADEFLSAFGSGGEE